MSEADDVAEAARVRLERLAEEMRDLGARAQRLEHGADQVRHDLVNLRTAIMMEQEIIKRTLNPPKETP